jgi:hypothetical protein
VSYDAGQASASVDVSLSASRLRAWLQDHGIEARVDNLAAFEAKSANCSSRRQPTGAAT